MHELRPSEFHRIASLFGSLPYGPTIPNAVIAGMGPGRVFVDDATQPTAALVYNGGACTLAGNSRSTGFGEAVCKWLLEYHGADYFILYADPGAWQVLLDLSLVKGVTKRRRLDFDFVPSKFALPNGWEDTIPSGYALRRIDRTLMEQVRGELLPYSRSYWRSAADFERDGVGFCLIHQEAIVSVCYTCFAWNGHHDIDVMTVESQRRRGLGRVVACAFIDHCLANGLTPNWDCWSKNQPSVALAARLGFVPRVEVTTYHGFAPEQRPSPDTRRWTLACRQFQRAQSNRSPPT
ncbi:GNAT family N-acetyltransferase [Pseudorhodoferax sp.]|uniref:GNAT family N-acetyltransferase n=1 Tax=Pseudorhodoferax sp. TaxID=1993553 RepID=UPI002DD68EE1|nr:GNAT family N-acetyltransferase [Pseudorhodoferax sp.]